MILFVRAKARSVGEYVLLGEAMLALVVAASSLKILPFRRLVAFAGRSTPHAHSEPRERERARAIARVRWGVQVCARRAPWRAKCFEQGLAAAWMLRRRGIAATLHYGVAKDPDGGLIAHVWVRAMGQDVIGCETACAFTDVARFPTQI